MPQGAGDSFDPETWKRYADLAGEWEDNWRGNIFCHCHGIRLGNRIFSVAGVATTLAACYIATTLPIW